MQQGRLERRWRSLIQAAEEGRHVSAAYVADLIRAGPIPDFARNYVADRMSRTIAPSGRPARPPLDPGDLASLWHHFDDTKVPWQRVFPKSSLSVLFPPQFLAVLAVRWRHGCYKAFETAREPRRENKPRLRWIESRGVWRLKNPKDEAACYVAQRLGVKQKTLDDWERRVRDWEHQARAFRLRSRLCGLLVNYLRLHSSKESPRS
jgi:hypothetical protein